MAKGLTRRSGSALTLRFGVPTDFEQVVARRADRPVITGELNPVFQGTYSNRIELKQWMREDERSPGELREVSRIGLPFRYPRE